MCDNLSTVKVAVRIRPVTVEEIQSKEPICIKPSGENQIVVGNDLRFTFDHLFKANSLQCEIFDQCVTDLIWSAFEGYNATILAYGQTGSGKTYTMGMSTEKVPSISKSFDNQGIIPRSIQAIFDTISRHEHDDSRHRYTLLVQFIEIYGDDIRDLSDTSISANRGSKNTSVMKDRDGKHTLREAANGDVFVTGVKEVTVTSVAQAIEILEAGGKQRVTAATEMNSESSRSHAIFTLVLEKTFSPLNDNTVSIYGCLSCVGDTSNTTVRRSSIHFVDLAGSERMKCTHAKGLQLREGIDINRGLLALGNVISALCDDQCGGKAHVPYRHSKLTRLLQNSLGGNSRTLFLCCVSPVGKDFVESANALKYANKARNIRNKPVVNNDPTLQAIDALQLLVQNLASQLLATMKPQSEGKETYPLTSKVSLTPNFLETLLGQRFLTDKSREQLITNVSKSCLLPSRPLQNRQNMLSPLLTEQMQSLQSPTVCVKIRSSIGTSPSREVTYTREDLLQARGEVQSSRVQLAATENEVSQLKEQLRIAHRTAQELDSRSLHLESERDGCKYKLDTIRASVNADNFSANASGYQSDDEVSDTGSATNDSVIDQMYCIIPNRTLADPTPYESYLIAKLTRKDSKIQNLKRQKYDLLSNYRAQAKRLQQLKHQISSRPQLETDLNIRSSVNPSPSPHHRNHSSIGPLSARAKSTHSPRISPRSSSSRQYTTLTDNTCQYFDGIDTDRTCYSSTAISSGHTPAAYTLSPIKEAIEGRDENLSPNFHTSRLNDAAPLLTGKESHCRRESAVSDYQGSLFDISTVNSLGRSVGSSLESNLRHHICQNSRLENVNYHNVFYTLEDTASPSRSSSLFSQITCDSHIDTSRNVGCSLQNLQCSEIGTIAGGTPILTRQNNTVEQCTDDTVDNTSFSTAMSPEKATRLTLMYGQVQNSRYASDEENERLCQHISTLKAEWRSMQLFTLEELNDLRALLSKSQAQAHAYATEKDRLITALESIKRSSKTPGDSVDALEIQCEDLREQLKSTEEGMALVIGSLQQQVCQLQAENKALSQPEENNGYIIHFNPLIEEDSVQIQLQAHIAKLLHQLENKQFIHSEEVLTLKRQVKYMEQRMVDDQEELVKILLERNSLHDKLNELSSTHRVLLEQKHETEASICGSNTELKYKEDAMEIFRLRSQLYETSQSLESLKHQLDEERAAVAHCRDNSDNHWQREEINRMHETIARLNSQLEASSQSSLLDRQLMRERILKLSEQMAELRETSVAEKDDLLRQLAEARAANDDTLDTRENILRLNNRINDLTHELESMREGRDLGIEELQKLEKQLAESREAYEIDRLMLTDHIAEMERSRSFWGGEDYSNSFVRDFEEDRELSSEMQLNHRISVSPVVKFESEQNHVPEYSARIAELETALCDLKLKCENDAHDYADNMRIYSQDCHFATLQKELLEQKIASLECELADVKSATNVTKVEEDRLRRESDVIPQPSLQVKILSTQLKDCKAEVDRLKIELASSRQKETSINTQESDRKVIKQLNEEIDHIHLYVIAERDRLAVRVKVLTQELEIERKVRSELECNLDALAPKVTTLERREAELASELQRTVQVKEQSVQQLEELNEKLSAVIESSVEEKSVLAQRIAQLDARLRSNDSVSDCRCSNSKEPVSPRGRRDTKLWFAPYDNKTENEFCRRHRDIAELWARQFHAMLEYCRHNGTCNVPRDYMHGDLALGKWLRTQKTLGTAPGRPRLLPERLALMQKLVDRRLMSWDTEA